MSPSSSVSNKTTLARVATAALQGVEHEMVHWLHTLFRKAFVPCPLLRAHWFRLATGPDRQPILLFLGLNQLSHATGLSGDQIITRLTSMAKSNSFSIRYASGGLSVTRTVSQ
jgi:hypothetical protein